MKMKTGARNNLVGKITEIKKGDIMCQVKLEIPAESLMSSVMTVDSLDNLGIDIGDEVQITVKAVNVLLLKS